MKRHLVITTTYHHVYLPGSDKRSAEQVVIGLLNNQLPDIPVDHQGLVEYRGLAGIMCTEIIDTEYLDGEPG